MHCKKCIHNCHIGSRCEFIASSDSGMEHFQTKLTIGSRKERLSLKNWLCPQQVATANETSGQAVAQDVCPTSSKSLQDDASPRFLTDYYRGWCRHCGDSTDVIPCVECEMNFCCECAPGPMKIAGLAMCNGLKHLTSSGEILFNMRKMNAHRVRHMYNLRVLDSRYNGRNQIEASRVLGQPRWVSRDAVPMRIHTSI